MAEKDTPAGTQEVRAVLAKAKEPMTIGEIFAKCDTIAESTAIASMMHAEVAAGRAERSGERGAYRYALTAEGQTAAANPRYVRSRFNRRTRGRGARPKANLEGVIASAKAKKAAAAPRAKRQPANRRAKAADTPRRGRPPGRSKTPRAAAARASSAQAVQHTTAPERDASARLAATVIARWPQPLEQMPDDVARELGRSLPTSITGA